MYRVIQKLGFFLASSTVYPLGVTLLHLDFFGNLKELLKQKEVTRDVGWSQRNYKVYSFFGWSGYGKRRNFEEHPVIVRASVYLSDQKE